jgi:hypothetical protein
LIGNVRFEFSRHRANDPFVYFTGDQAVATSYANDGSEVIADALITVHHLLDYSGNHREARAWAEAEVRKMFQPVVLTLALPTAVFCANHRELHGPLQITDEVLVGIYLDTPFNTMRLKAPIPASWIVATTPV